MRSLVLEAHAKINLTLEVLFRRGDGFHQINTVLQELALCDTLYLEEISGRKIELSCEENFLFRKDSNTVAGALRPLPAGEGNFAGGPAGPLPRREGNLAYEAARLLQERHAPQKGVRIRLIKKIPVAAGLGGGSSDAAAVLSGLNKLWGLSLKKETLREIGAGLGSDVPFFLYGGTALAAGRGELVCPLPSFPKTKVLLAAPAGMALSAAQVYSFLNLDKIPAGAAAARVIDLLKKNGSEQEKTREKICRLLCNHLELSVFPQQKEVAVLKEKLLQQGLPALLSGSGPTVFAFAPAAGILQQVAEGLVAAGYRVILTETI